MLFRSGHASHRPVDDLRHGDCRGRHPHVVQEMIERLLKFIETVLAMLIVSMLALRAGYLFGAWLQT